MSITQEGGSVVVSLDATLTPDEAQAAAAELADAAQAAANFRVGELHQATIDASQASAVAAQTGTDPADREAVTALSARVTELEAEVSNDEAKLADLQARLDAAEAEDAAEDVAAQEAVQQANDDSVTPPDVVPPVEDGGAEPDPAAVA